MGSMPVQLKSHAKVQPVATSAHSRPLTHGSGDSGTASLPVATSQRRSLEPAALPARSPNLTAPQQIGAIAKASGVPIKTIRYYEEIGLLQSSGRTEGGYRLFDGDVLSRLNFIKRSQQVGLSLADIKELLDIHDQGGLPCDRVRGRLTSKMAEIDQQIEQLQTLKQQLGELLVRDRPLDEFGEHAICPILEQEHL